jgi:hypothetical protein
MTWEIYWDFSLLSYICCKGTKNFWNIQIYIKVFLIFTNLIQCGQKNAHKKMTLANKSAILWIFVFFSSFMSSCLTSVSDERLFHSLKNIL